MVLEPRVLDWRRVLHLGANLAPHDKMECLNGDPMSTLAGATTTGQAFAATKGDHLDDMLGAFGYTDHGTIWSLWRPLDREESFQIMRHTRLWVRALLADSKRDFLYNYVSAANRSAKGWLQLSGCFWVSDKVVSYGPTEAQYFRTLPMEEL